MKYTTVIPIFINITIDVNNSRNPVQVTINEIY